MNSDCCWIGVHINFDISECKSLYTKEGAMFMEELPREHCYHDKCWNLLIWKT